MDITIDVNDYKLNVRAACVIKHNNKILVHKNINSNYYCLIGGRVKIGEDSETTIKREVEEEIGKQIEITGYIATIENFFEMKGSKYHEYMFVYQAEFKKEAEDKKGEEELKNEEGKDYLKYIWLDLDNINEQPIFATSRKRNIKRRENIRNIK